MCPSDETTITASSPLCCCHIRAHTFMHTHTHAFMHTHTHPFMHTHTRSCTRTHTRVHAHTHAHTVDLEQSGHVQADVHAPPMLTRRSVDRPFNRKENIAFNKHVPDCSVRKGNLLDTTFQTPPVLFPIIQLPRRLCSSLLKTPMSVRRLSML